MKKIKKAKIGFNRGASRIWIEGAALREAGFTMGQYYSLTVDNQARVMIAKLLPEDMQGKDDYRKVSGRIRNGKEIAIIDLSGEWIDDCFPNDEAVRVTYTKNRIVFSRLEGDE